jgi:alkylhydroperoxidase/carboxymuconolactone decarboxylase family protein YurZ
MAIDETVPDSSCSGHIMLLAQEELMAEAPETLPFSASMVAPDYPKIWSACAAVRQARSEASAIESHSLCFVKLALARGAPLEGAVHSHTHRALAEDIPEDELRQATLLAIPTLGFRQGVKALTRIEDVIDVHKRRAQVMKPGSFVGSSMKGSKANGGPHRERI